MISASRCKYKVDLGCDQRLHSQRTHDLSLVPRAEELVGHGRRRELPSVWDGPESDRTIWENDWYDEAATQTGDMLNLDTI